MRTIKIKKARLPGRPRLGPSPSSRPDPGPVSSAGLVGSAGWQQRRPHRALASDIPSAIYCSFAISCEKDHGLALR